MPNAQQALEISSGFVLDQIKLARQLLDLQDALIIVAVTQANVDPVIRDPALQRAYATYDAPPPDDLRRPISINALSQSLRLPFETVRRRVTRLVLLGILKSSADGVWTPGARVRTPIHRRVAEAAYGRLLALHHRLAHLPDLGGLPHGEAWEGPPPLRAAARISTDYLLRTVDVLTSELGGPVDAAIWLEILRSNTAESIEASSGGAVERMPVRPGAVAKQLGLPNETVRRRVANLVARSACEHAASGLLISSDTLERPEFRRMAQRNLADLRRMFAGLAQFGVLLRPPLTARAAA